MSEISLPTIEQINKDNLIEVVRKLDPELYLIKIALEETGIPSSVIPKIIRLLGNLTIGAGYGKVQIHMQAKVITGLEATEKLKLDEL